MVRERWWRWVPAGYSLVLALVVVGPLLGSGYLLLRDAVSTPRSYLTDAALGVGDAAPRAVPQDALVAALSGVVDGGVVVKVILVGALWLAGWGAAVLARELLGASPGARLVAATVAVWNPYVAERLLQGHWSLLTGYAALPWIAVLAQRIRGEAGSGRWERARNWTLLGGCLAAAGLTPTGSLLAGATALLVVGRRNLAGAVGLWVITAAPWLTATALSGAGAEPSDPAGVAAFAARAEPGLGTLGSLAGLGGIWNSTAVPGSRTTFFAVIGTLLLLSIVALGVRTVVTGARDTRRIRRILLALAGFAIVLPALAATGWGLSLGEALIEHVPGAGLLRDTQKYVALAMPAFALCAAAGCHTAAGLLFRDRSTTVVVASVPTTPPPAAAAEGDDKPRNAFEDAPRPATSPASAGGPAPDAPDHDPAANAPGGSDSSTPPADRTAPEPAADSITSPTFAAGTAPSDNATSTAITGTPDLDTPTADTAPDAHAGDTAQDTPMSSATSDTPTSDTAADSPTGNTTRGIPISNVTPDTPASDTVLDTTTSAPAFGSDTPTGSAVADATSIEATTVPGDSRSRTGAVAVLFIALLIAALPDLAWGVGGELRPVHYPPAWGEVAELVDAPGDVAVLPGGMFRKFRYSGPAPVLDPAPRMLRRDVLQTGELPVRGTTVAGEGARAGEVERLLLRGGSATELARLGVGWVLVEGGTPGPVGESKTTLAQLEPVYYTPALQLYRVPGPITAHDATPATRRTSGAAHLAWAALLVAGTLAALTPRRRAQPTHPTGPSAAS
ncbi:MULTISPECIES: hypothetical protein [unclassified Nocardia]|uniref:hypothetical protein n=1 Tax=unclassified Nocardia TaxID=2637762 RepID=UPI00278BE1A5|nr:MULTISPECIES: hypothetical protein [unclassified Nocardia]